MYLMCLANRGASRRRRDVDVFCASDVRAASCFLDLRRREDTHNENTRTKRRKVVEEHRNIWSCLVARNLSRGTHDRQRTNQTTGPPGQHPRRGVGCRVVVVIGIVTKEEQAGGTFSLAITPDDQTQATGES